MTRIEKPAASGQPETNRVSAMRWMDIAATVLALLGVCILAGGLTVMAVFDFARLFPCFWANPQDRWLVIVLGLAAIWVAVRWKKMSVL
jgi:hypothetical protein